jgi:ribosomal-protein-alanine N-acetyltransferase
MQAVVAQVAPLMKARGFKKQRNTFNRATADGLVHVLNFQMGPYEPIPPSLSEAEKQRHIEAHIQILGHFSLYGQFTVNPGVFIPEVGDLSRPMSATTWSRPAFIQEAACHIRSRLGPLYANDDVWWSLEAPVEELGASMNELIEEYGLPFLDRFPDRNAILAQVDDDPKTVPFLGVQARIALATMAAARHDHQLAYEVLQAHHRNTVLEGWRTRHAEYVEEVAQHFGYELLPPGVSREFRGKHRLSTARLLLRPFQARDIEDALAYRNDPEFATFLPHVPQPFSRKDAQEFISMNMTESWDRFPTFAVVLRDAVGLSRLNAHPERPDGRVIGTVNLEFDPEAGSAMLGYAIGREWWNQGITTEAARAVMAWGFETFGVDRIWASTDARHSASRRVMEKLGMRFEEERKSDHLGRDGQPVDEVLYAVSRAEFAARS